GAFRCARGSSSLPQTEGSLAIPCRLVQHPPDSELSPSSSNLPDPLAMARVVPRAFFGLRALRVCPQVLNDRISGSKARVKEPHSRLQVRCRHSGDGLEESALHCSE